MIIDKPGVGVWDSKTKKQKASAEREERSGEIFGGMTDMTIWESSTFGTAKPADWKRRSIFPQRPLLTYTNDGQGTLCNVRSPPLQARSPPYRKN